MSIAQRCVAILGFAPNPRLHDCTCGDRGATGTCWAHLRHLSLAAALAALRYRRRPSPTTAEDLAHVVTGRSLTGKSARQWASGYLRAREASP